MPAAATIQQRQRTRLYSRPPTQLCHRKFKIHRKLMTIIWLEVTICGRVDGIRTAAAAVICHRLWAAAWGHSKKRECHRIIRYQIPRELMIITTRAKQIIRQWRRSERPCIRRTLQIEAAPMRMSISKSTCCDLRIYFLIPPFLYFQLSQGHMQGFECKSRSYR